jgi:hypothetical protein
MKLVFKRLKSLRFIFSNNSFNQKSEKEKSWDEVENFFKFLKTKMPENETLLDNILVLINQIRIQGFEKSLYAGVSVMWLKISTSRLDTGKVSKNTIIFDWPENGIRITDSKGVSIFQQTECIYSIEIEKIIERLI